MGDQNSRRIGSRLERSQRQMRIIFLILSAILIAVGLILTVMIFFYLLRFTLHPADLESLVSDWAKLLVDTTRQGNAEILDEKAGPARWFAIVALLVLGFLLSRIPLLLIRMGTSLFHASQDHQRQTKAILREVLLELRYANGESSTVGSTPKEIAEVSSARNPAPPTQE